MTSSAQSEFKDVDFTKTDSFAITVQYHDDLIKLSKDLTSNYTEEVLKVRAIFKWITENIAYDYKFINKGKEEKKPDCENVINCEQKITDWKKEYLKKLLRRKKGICGSYALLFKTLCDYANIKSEIIDGYARTKPYQIGNPIIANHAWNSVQINGSWYYLDATWAAGGCSEDEDSGLLTGYIKRFTPYYWLTPYENLRRNHFPKNGKWAVQDNFTKEKFFNQPHYYSQTVLENISLNKPDSGVIFANKGDTIRFRFNYLGDISKLQINSNIFKNPPLWYKEQVSKRKSIMVRDTSADRKQVYIPFKKSGTTYEFNYIIQNTSLYYLDIIFDYKKALRYRVKIMDQ